MTHHTNPAIYNLPYLAVLLLLAYIMSSAPKYVRSLTSEPKRIEVQKSSPIQQVLRFARYYTVDPYVKAWNSLTPAPSTDNLADLR